MVTDDCWVGRRVWVGSRGTTGVIVRVHRNHSFLSPSNQIVVRVSGNVVAVLPELQEGRTWDFIDLLCATKRHARKVTDCHSNPLPVRQID
jgi:hypothetical protein